jgi:hypothetical protein
VSELITQSSKKKQQANALSQQNQQITQKKTVSMLHNLAPATESGLFSNKKN